MQKPLHSVLYVLPEPSTALLRPPVLRRVRPHSIQSSRMLTVSCLLRNEGQPAVEELQFIEPLANAVYSLFAVPDFASVAYDKVVEYLDSNWLQDIRARIASRPTKMNTSNLRHLAVMFDDGSYYEFICRDFGYVRRPGRVAQSSD